MVEQEQQWGAFIALDVKDGIDITANQLMGGTAEVREVVPINGRNWIVPALPPELSYITT